MEWETLSAGSTEALHTAIKGANIVGILAGHIHMDRVSHWYSVPVVIGMGNHAGTDALSFPRAFHMLDGSGLGVCTLYLSGLTTTFVPHPQTREVRHMIDMQLIADHIAAHRAAAE
ncbi:hypothetical protein [Pseudodonghicola xiamenensis]|uniref:Calcineurin-like phosphoesterase domain-containing protein n=1 Tax=Pseudodonghicola xiamenensis TaxID=337702 RepID=A0A8J3HAZ0_9RHOB|nr:hypothetical protein [Pseudodonghicola xiamenensis]GHG97257.1 hypothetical protein GCM10010961_32000 [Pseudodonghicola xiamenensis]